MVSAASLDFWPTMRLLLSMTSLPAPPSALANTIGFAGVPPSTQTYFAMLASSNVTVLEPEISPSKNEGSTVPSGAAPLSQLASVVQAVSAPAPVHTSDEPPTM